MGNDKLDHEGAQWIRWRSQQRDARPAAVVDEMIAASSARLSRPDPTQRGRLQGNKSGKTREPFPIPTPMDQTQEESRVPNGSRKRHPPKPKPASEEGAAETSKPASQEAPSDEGWSRPLLYEGVRPDEWGREVQEHGH